MKRLILIGVFLPILSLAQRKTNTQEAQSGWTVLDTRNLFPNNSNTFFVSITDPIPSKYQSKPFDEIRDGLLTLDIEIEALSRIPFKIKKGQIKYLVNGIETPEINTGQSSIAFSAAVNHQIRATIRVPEGTSDIRVVFSQPNQPNIFSRNSLKVNYVPIKPNLYLFAAGIDCDLRYAKSDAQAVYDVFMAQKGRVFEEVEGELVEPLQTQGAVLKTRLADFAANLKTKALREGDCVIVFLSGHGRRIITETKQEDFGIEGKDYSITNENLKTLRYNTDILAYLDTTIRCKKLILLDACSSGAALGAKSSYIKDMNEARKVLNKTPAGTVLMVSSSKDELSYEDAVWQHGAFTKALLDGLQGAANANSDKYIGVNELFEYVRKQVPNMVEKTKGATQTPDLKNKVGKDFPIFQF